MKEDKDFLSSCGCIQLYVWRSVREKKKEVPVNTLSAVWSPRCRQQPEVRFHFKITYRATVISSYNPQLCLPLSYTALKVCMEQSVYGNVTVHSGKIYAERYPPRNEVNYSHPPCNWTILFTRRWLNQKEATTMHCTSYCIYPRIQLTGHGVTCTLMETTRETDSSSQFPFFVWVGGARLPSTRCVSHSWWVTVKHCSSHWNVSSGHFKMAFCCSYTLKIAIWQINMTGSKTSSSQWND